MQQESSALRLLNYRELLLTLQHLCKEQRTGTMLINDGSQNSAKLILEQGIIFNAFFKEAVGEPALLLIKEIKQGTVSFTNRVGQATVSEPKIALSTQDIFQLLISTPSFNDPTAKTDKKIPEPALVSASPASAIGGMSPIEAQLAVVIGPVAKLLYLDYSQEIQEVNDFKALNVVVDKVSKQLLGAEQLTLFRQGMLAFVNQYNLKGQEATLTALKGSQKKLRLSTASLALCIAKHAVLGILGTQLLDNLVFQLERGGNVGSAVGLFDVLRLLEKSTRTGLLEVREKEKIGGFYFDKGVLFNAVEFGMNGKLIAFDIMQWPHDYLVFRGVAQEGVSRQITQSIDTLIKELEKLKAQDEKIEVNTPPSISKANEVTLIADAIHLIEGGDNCRAEQMLVSVLMQYEENFKGWFWLTRVLTNMTAIEIALKKAAFLQPKNTELAEEIKKFTLVRKNIKGDFVLRCPFCWTPNDEHDFECAYCKSNFFITPDFFKTIGKAKTEILDKAIERYGNVLQQEQGHAQNTYLRFYLAMAYLNRKYYQEGLDQLHEITKLLPDNNALLMQSRILTDYMNTEGLLRASTHLLQGAEKSVESSVTGLQRKILVVEDSMVTRKVIARTLVANGYEVFEAKNSIEALNDFEKRSPNLILLDIILPGRDGYEILAEIRQKPGFEKLPVVMLTSRDSLFDKLKGKVSDANEYLTKPFQPDELLAIVRKYLK